MHNRLYPNNENNINITNPSSSITSPQDPQEEYIYII
jgi:hypothetical protein